MSDARTDYDAPSAPSVKPGWPLGDGAVHHDDVMHAVRACTSAAETLMVLKAARRGPSAEAIAYAFVEAAREFPEEFVWLARFADRVLLGRRACRSRWIAAAALREVYGTKVDFLLNGWGDNVPGTLRAQARQGWWHADLQARIVKGLRFRFGG